jgi:DNA-binding GntR family transcriptional regulator
MTFNKLRKVQDLSKRLEIDRRQVHAALLIIEQEGLVEPCGKKGWRVLRGPRSEETFRQGLELRDAIESYVISKIVGNGLDCRVLEEGYRALEEAHRELMAAFRSGTPVEKRAAVQAFYLADLGMHGMLFDIAGLGGVKKVMIQIRDLMLGPAAHDLADDPERGKRRAAEILKEHKEWMDILLSDLPQRQKEAAALAKMREHLDRASGRAIRALQEDRRTAT